jgi:hypothetical protein
MASNRKGSVYLTSAPSWPSPTGPLRGGKDSRGDTAAVWEVRSGELRENDSAPGARERRATVHRLKKEALDRMKLVYYDPALLPHARPTGVYYARGDSYLTT